MTNRQKTGIGILVLAAIFAGVAFKNSFITATIPVSHESGLGVSRLVGAFLPTIILLIVGLWLLPKPKA